MRDEAPNAIIACPGCVAAPAAAVVEPPAKVQLALSLPTIHCQNCITSVERGLADMHGVKSARVNLTLKRVLIDAEPSVMPGVLIERLKDLGFEAHELDTASLGATQTDLAGRALLTRLAVAGFASMNVMLLSVSVWSGATDATRDMFHWISAAITLPAIAYAAQPFFRSAWSALRAHRLNMDVPIVLAILLALVTSLWETSLSGAHAYFDAALTLTFFLLAGRYLDHRTRAIARSAAEELSALEVPRALLLGGAEPREVPVAELRLGDLLLVRPGARMPVDGEIVEGRSEIDRSLLTGETIPVFAEPGQKVSAGEINLTGPLRVRAEAVGRDTSLHRLADLVAVAESGRAQYNSLADAAARLYAPLVHILAAASFLGWLLYAGDMRVALNIASAVLIITCPCALGLAVPAVTTAASGRLFRKGMLIKHATALERLGTVDHVVFDKTGTLTTGKPELRNLSEFSSDELAVAAALAQASSHPLSQSLVEAFEKAHIVPAPVTSIAEVPGYGTTGQLNGAVVRLGRASWVGAERLNSGATGDTATWLSIGKNRPPRAFLFSDSLRPGAAQAVKALMDQGKSIALISGDTTEVVRSMADRLGITDWTAEALPEEKAARIEDWKASGKKVLMVGDGLNDTVALAAADVSISPASALDAARVASDIVLLNQDLSVIAGACETAKIATRRIRQNFRIATVYNVIAVPLAVAGLATPLIAALAMSSSSITVSLNALRLRGAK